MATITYRQGVRGTTVRIRVSAGYDEEGRQIVKSMTYQPDPALEGERLEADVAAVARRFERQIRDGAPVLSQAASQLFSDFCAYYLKDRRSWLSEPTWYTYRRIIEDRILPALGDLRMGEVSAREIRSFINDLTAPGARQDQRGGCLNPRTVLKIYSVLQSIFSLAVKLDILEQSPCRKDKIQLPEPESPAIQFYTPQEASKMLACLEQESVKWKCLIYLALFTGMRRGELVALTWQDVDLTTGLISVNKSNYKLIGQQVKTKGTKTKQSVRSLYVPINIRSMLAQWKQTQDEHAMNMAGAWNPGGVIFTRKDGRPMSPDSVSTLWRQFLLKYDLPLKKFHSLRHSNATILLAEGLSLADVSAQLGHTNLKTTSIYTHAMRDSSRRAAQAMEHIFFPPPKSAGRPRKQREIS